MKVKAWKHERCDVHNAKSLISENTVSRLIGKVVNQLLLLPLALKSECTKSIPNKTSPKYVCNTS